MHISYEFITKSDKNVVDVVVVEGQGGILP